MSSRDAASRHTRDQADVESEGHKHALANTEREVAVLLAVAQALTAWDRLEHGSERLLRGLAEALGLQAGALWLPQGDVLVARTIWSAPSADRMALERVLRQLRLAKGVGLPGYAWEHRQAIDRPISPAREDRGSQAALGGLHAVVALPALAGQDVLGVVELYSAAQVEFSEGLMHALAAVGQVFGAFFAHRRTELTPSPLTPRELEVLVLAAQGLARRETARQLSIKPATVKTHLEHVYAKLGVANRTAAVAYALRAGLIE
jgi:DNA-binding CsgD family transcriptional regulator